jgi:GNAT superfamily N-acetyltransferase
MGFKTITELDEIKDSYLLLKEIRDNQTLDDFCTMFYFMKDEDYKMIGLYENSELITVSNIKLDFNSAYGKYIYIYDLVTKPEKRSQGYGKKMIKYISSLAISFDCENLVLNSLIDKVEAHRFYKRENFEQNFYALVKPLKNSSINVS